MATLVASSTFADSRPAEETKGSRAAMGGDRGSVRTESRSGDSSANRSGGGRIERGGSQPDSGREARVSESNREVRQPDRDASDGRGVTRDRDSDRTYDRDPGEDARTADRSRGDNRGHNGGNDRGGDRGHDGWNNGHSNERNDTWRGDNRSRGGNYGSNHYGNRTPHYSHGRVSRISPWNGGYRVWIGGAPYPFFVPLAYWRHDRFRVGFNLRIGGFYNSLGYYDYCDPYYDDDYRYSGYSGSSRGYSRADLRGTVESVDERRGTFVIRNDATGSFVTVVTRNRRDDNVRPGDYVEVSGDWSRSGLFEARDVELLRDERDER